MLTEALPGRARAAAASRRRLDDWVRSPTWLGLGSVVSGQWSVSGLALGLELGVGLRSGSGLGLGLELELGWGQS